MFVVFGRLKAEEREPEAVLAAALAVAAAAVAAVLGEHRDNMAVELDRRVVAEPLDDQRHAGLGQVGEAGHGGDGDHDLALAVRGGNDDAFRGDLGEGFGFDPIDGLPRDVLLMLGVGSDRNGADHKLPASLGADDMDRATPGFPSGNHDSPAGRRIGSQQDAGGQPGEDDRGDHPAEQGAGQGGRAELPRTALNCDRQHGHVHGCLFGGGIPHNTLIKSIPKTVPGRKVRLRTPLLCGHDAISVAVRDALQQIESRYRGDAAAQCGRLPRGPARCGPRFGA